MRLSVKGELSEKNLNLETRRFIVSGGRGSLHARQGVPPAPPCSPLLSSPHLTLSPALLPLQALRGPNLTTILRTSEHEVC